MATSDGAVSHAMSHAMMGDGTVTMALWDGGVRGVAWDVFCLWKRACKPRGNATTKNKTAAHCTTTTTTTCTPHARENVDPKVVGQ